MPRRSRRRQAPTGGGKTHAPIGRIAARSGRGREVWCQAVFVAHTRRAGSGDLDVLFERERLRADELAAIVDLGRVLVAEHEDSAGMIGWLRWGTLWDAIPFMNRLHVDEPHRLLGVGRLLVDGWESLCRSEGSTMVMTSTVSAESAQHFYRNLGYVDTGCLVLPEVSIEIIFRKQIA